MADNTDIAFDLQVKGVEQSIKSVKDLKSAITALQNEAESSDIGSEQYKNAIEQLELLNDKLKEVSQTEKQATKSAEDLSKAEKEATKETQDLRKQFEVLEDELFLLAGQGKQNTKQFKDLTVEAAKLNKKIDEVNSSLGGNETERAAMGFSKLKDGLMNLDFKSVKEGLNGIKTALAATGVMLIVMAVSYLIANFDELSKGSGGLAKALRFVGDIIGQVVAAGEKMLNFITDTLGLTNELSRSIEKQGEVLLENSNKTKAALAEQVKGFDNQIAAAKAAGKSTVDLEIAKQEAIIETNKKIAEQMIAFVKSGGVMTTEQKKLFDESITNIKNAKASENLVIITAEKDKNDKLKASRDAEYAIRLAESDAFWNNELANIAADKAAKDAAMFAEEQAQLDLEARQVAQDEAMIAGTQARNDKARQDKKDKDKAAADESAAEEKMWRENSLQAAGELTTSLSSLSDSYFYFKRKNLEKGSSEDLKQAKKQFNINKGLAIASATISGIQGVVNALSAQSILPEPFGTALKAVTAVAVGVAAGANIAKISSSKFNEGGGGGGGGVSPATPSIPAPPTISTPENNTNKTTSFDETGKNLNAPTTVTPTIKVTATVGVDEISAKKDRVDVLENQSTFK